MICPTNHRRLWDRIHIPVHKTTLKVFVSSTLSSRSVRPACDSQQHVLVCVIQNHSTSSWCRRQVSKPQASARAVSQNITSVRDVKLHFQVHQFMYRQEFNNPDMYQLFKPHLWLIDTDPNVNLMVEVWPLVRSQVLWEVPESIRNSLDNTYWPRYEKLVESVISGFLIEHHKY